LKTKDSKNFPIFIFLSETKIIAPTTSS
jgi:hypothetical protein